MFVRYSCEGNGISYRVHCRMCQTFYKMDTIVLGWLLLVTTWINLKWFLLIAVWLQFINFRDYHSFMWFFSGHFITIQKEWLPQCANTLLSCRCNYKYGGKLFMHTRNWKSVQVNMTLTLTVINTLHSKAQSCEIVLMNDNFSTCCSVNSKICCSWLLRYCIWPLHAYILRYLVIVLRCKDFKWTVN